MRHDVRQPLLEARHLAGQPHRFAEVVSLLWVSGPALAAGAGAAAALAALLLFAKERKA